MTRHFVVFCPLLLCGYLLCFTLSLIKGDTNCTGTLMNNDTCLTLIDKTLTWNDAEAACESQQGILIPLSDNTSQSALLEFLREKGLSSGGIGVWVGGKSGNVSSMPLWLWVAGCQSCATVFNQALVASTLQQGCYVDFSLARNLPYAAVTEYPSLTPTVCQDFCKRDGWSFAGTQSGKDCYCGDTFGGGNYELQSISCTEPCTGCWTIQCKPQLFCGGYTKNYVYSVDGGYSSWSQYKPANANNTCGAMDQSDNYNFADESCNNAYPYLCLLNSAALCNTAPSDGVGFLVSGRCYFLATSPAGLPWYEARQSCLSRGGDLAKIFSSSDHQTIRNNVSASYSFASQRIWIGLTRILWSWTNGQDMTFNNFQANQPMNFQSSNCLSVSVQNGGLVWSIGSCDKTTMKYSVCDTSLRPKTTPMTSPSLTQEQIVLIAVLVPVIFFLLLLLVLLAILIYCCLKHKKNSRVSPTKNAKKYDARYKARTPECGPIGDEARPSETKFDHRRTTNLIPPPVLFHHDPISNRPNSPVPLRRQPSQLHQSRQVSSTNGNRAPGGASGTWNGDIYSNARQIDKPPAYEKSWNGGREW